MHQNSGEQLKKTLTAPVAAASCAAHKKISVVPCNRRASPGKGKKVITVPKNNVTAVHPSITAALSKTAKEKMLAHSMAYKSPDHATDMAVRSTAPGVAVHQRPALLAKCALMRVVPRHR